MLRQKKVCLTGGVCSGEAKDIHRNAMKLVQKQVEIQRVEYSGGSAQGNLDSFFENQNRMREEQDKADSTSEQLTARG